MAASGHFVQKYALPIQNARSRDNSKSFDRIAFIFDMYIDMGEGIAGKQDGPGGQNSKMATGGHIEY